jgi:hypothetical protein
MFKFWIEGNVSADVDCTKRLFYIWKNKQIVMKAYVARIVQYLESSYHYNKQTLYR